MSQGLELNSSAWLMLTCEVMIVGVALVRGDFQTVLTLGLLCTTTLVVLIQRPAVKADLLNTLFLLSIAANAVSYALGRSDATVLPGYAIDAVYFRVSLFPQVAASAFFSVVILFVNILNPGARFRYLCVVLSLYFLVLSGIRSAMVAGLIAGIYIVLRRRGILRSPFASIAYLGASIVAYVVILFAPELLVRFSGPDNPLSFFLFRSRGEVLTEEQITLAIYRTLLWQEHFKIAQANPIFGIGTFDFTKLSEKLGHLSIGSESFVTGTYARIGVPVLVFVAALLSAVRTGLRRNKEIAMVVGIILFVAMLTYGGFIAAYDFNFLTLMGLLAGAARPPLRAPSRQPSGVARLKQAQDPI
jgi:O-antigen ligase